MQPFTAADINDLRIGNRHRDGTDRTGWLIVKNRLPRSPAIGRFENAAIDLRHVKDVWLREHLRLHEFDRRGMVRRCAIAARQQNPRRPRVRKVQGRRTISSDQRKEIVELAYGSRTSAAPCGSPRRRVNLEIILASEN